LAAAGGICIYILDHYLALRPASLSTGSLLPFTDVCAGGRWRGRWTVACRRRNFRGAISCAASLPLRNEDGGFRRTFLSRCCYLLSASGGAAAVGGKIWLRSYLNAAQPAPPGAYAPHLVRMAAALRRTAGRKAWLSFTNHLATACHCSDALLHSWLRAGRRASAGYRVCALSLIIRDEWRRMDERATRGGGLGGGGIGRE